MLSYSGIGTKSSSAAGAIRDCGHISHPPHGTVLFLCICDPVLSPALAALVFRAGGVKSSLYLHKMLQEHELSAASSCSGNRSRTRTEWLLHSQLSLPPKKREIMEGKVFPEPDKGEQSASHNFMEARVGAFFQPCPPNEYLEIARSLRSMEKGTKSPCLHPQLHKHLPGLVPSERINCPHPSGLQLAGSAHIYRHHPDAGDTNSLNSTPSASHRAEQCCLWSSPPGAMAPPVINFRLPHPGKFSNLAPLWSGEDMKKASWFYRLTSTQSCPLHLQAPHLASGSAGSLTSVSKDPPQTGTQMEGLKKSPQKDARGWLDPPRQPSDSFATASMESSATACANLKTKEPHSSHPPAASSAPSPNFSSGPACIYYGLAAPSWQAGIKQLGYTSHIPNQNNMLWSASMAAPDVHGPPPLAFAATSHLHPSSVLPGSGSSNHSELPSRKSHRKPPFDASFHDSPPTPASVPIHLSPPLVGSSMPSSYALVYSQPLASAVISQIQSSVVGHGELASKREAWSMLFPTLSTVFMLPHFTRGSLAVLASGEQKRVEDLQLEDFLKCPEASPELQLSSCVVGLIQKSHHAGFASVEVYLRKQEMKVCTRVPSHCPHLLGRERKCQYIPYQREYHSLTRVTSNSSLP